MSSPPTVADELRQAAVLMRERAEAANSDDARRPYSDRSVDPVPEAEWGALVDNYLGGEIGAHCAGWTPAAALAVADVLDREAARVGSHAITVHKVREDWWSYDCHTCGVGGSASEAGLARWQELHSRVRPVADDALLALARAYVSGGETRV